MVAHDSRPDPWLLLRAALLPGAEAVEAWREWRAGIAGDALDPGSRDLLPLAGYVMRAHGLRDPLLDTARDAEHACWLRNAQRLHALSGLLHALRERGVDTLALKGAALVLRYYPDAGLRAMYDTDLLVPATRAVEVMRFLIATGWTAVGLRTTARAPERALAVRHAHAFEDRRGEQLDLHWHVLWECCDARADEAFWDASVPMTVAGAETRTLGATDQLLHVCVHGARDNRAAPLRWAADAMLVLRAGPIDWDRLLALARRHALTLPLRDTLARLAARLDAPVPPDVLRALAREPVSPLYRLEHAARRRVPAVWATAVLTACHHVRLSRDRSLARTLAGFPRYLKRAYELDHLTQLVPLLARRVRRRRST